MHLNHSLIILAQAPAAQQQPPFWTSLVPLVLLVVVFYFLLIRPQQKKAKDHAALLKTIKTGDKILTSGGVIGIVTNVRDKAVTIRSADTKLEITRTAIAEITERGGQSSES
jgi:preprotein translocase subunit YajC